MNREGNDPNDRMRTILQRMERSIDDARSKRVEGTATGSAYTPGMPNSTATRSQGTPRALDPLDTPIADSTPGKPSESEPNAAVRDAGTMFDFKGPRLKARPKRSTND
ncbi:MAG: hypothetical protein QMB94_04805 [Phycisphaerales bacterium]